MRIQRMAFIQHDPQSGTSQILFLLRSGHDLELECQIRTRKGQVSDEPLRLAFTLDDKLVNQLDRHKRNTHESYAAWRNVIAVCLDKGPGVIGKPVNALIGLAAVAMFGEPTWQIDDELIPANSKMLQLIRVHHEKVR